MMMTFSPFIPIVVYFVYAIIRYGRESLIPTDEWTINASAAYDARKVEEARNAESGDYFSPMGGSRVIRFIFHCELQSVILFKFAFRIYIKLIFESTHIGQYASATYSQVFY